MTIVMTTRTNLGSKRAAVSHRQAARDARRGLRSSSRARASAAEETPQTTAAVETTAPSDLVTSSLRTLGGSDVQVAPVGIGAWSWGDNL